MSFRISTSGEHTRYVCGYCEIMVSGERFLVCRTQLIMTIAVCPNCGRTTNFSHQDPLPPYPLPGRQIRGLPPKVEGLYEEVRRCVASGAYTAAVLVGRTILMHVAVDHEQQAGLNYTVYVDFLDRSGLIPSNARAWVDRIRRFGNAGAHEADLSTSTDGDALLAFLELLLVNVYEAPALLAAL